MSSIIAQIDCEEERAEQVAGYLDNLNRSEESRFTVYAILAGAGFAVLTGSLYLYDPSMNSVEGLVVLGGLLEGYYGYRILTVENRESFHHPINPIQEVYSPENGSRFFPYFLWILLNDSNYSLGNSDTIQSKLSRRWDQFEIKEIQNLEIEDDGIERKAWDIMMSDGGIYTAKKLKLRASMLDQIEASVSLVKYNLALLYKEIMEI
ncbi:MAG: hypothetical protein JJT78_15515 [Leptospira sp.]|nr:hypothetical protein [Leptospira sp.]